MGRGTPTTVWTADLDRRLCRLISDGATYFEAADALGVPRGALGGRVNRLRAAGDPRLPPKKPSPIAPKIDLAALAPIDALAELLARGSPDAMTASKRLGISITTGQRLWHRICRDLGPQAI